MIDAKVRAHLDQFKLAAEIKARGIICLAGKNGAGKSTFLRALAGFIEIDEGYVRIGELDVTRLPVEKRKVVAVTPGSYFPHLDVDSHIVWGAKIKGIEIGQEKVSRIKSELGIDFGGPVGKLSLGMRERVSLATALVAGPKAVLVDEAFSSLHAREDFIVSYGRLLNEAQIDLVFTSQDEADGRLANAFYLMKGGISSLCP